MVYTSLSNGLSGLPVNQYETLSSLEEIATVTVCLNRQFLKQDEPMLSRDEILKRSQPDIRSIELIKDFAQSYGLESDFTQWEYGYVKLTGSLEALGKAFNVAFGLYKYNDTDESFRGYSGDISIPSELKEYVRTVLGLDNRRVIRPSLYF